MDKKDMNQEMRRTEIAMRIAREESVRTIQLAKEFSVSREMILKDLMALEKEGILVRVWGGAVKGSATKERPFLLRKTDHAKEKEVLSQRLVEYINDGSVIFLTSSSTNMHVASMLEEKNDLTIFTNSPALINSLNASRHKLYLIGGLYYPKAHHTVGQYALEMIHDMRFDVCIFSMDGCKGLTGPGTNEVSSHVFSKMVFQNSNYRIIISDQSKLDLPANYQVYEFNDYDLVITDTLTDEHRRVFIEENGLNPDRLLEVAVL